MHLDSRLVHPEFPAVDGVFPLAAPLYQTSGFSYGDPDLFAATMNDPRGGFVYTRLGNPTVRALENAAAALEGGAVALATGSGSGAISAVLQAVVRSGDHIVAQKRLYGGTHKALHDLSERFGVGLTLISGDDAAELSAAIRPSTKVLYLETVSNPSAYVSDIPALAAVARDAGLITVVDNTFAPLLCQPLDLGADVSIHSTTKYLEGHAGVIGGVAVFASASLHERVWHYAIELGVTADPFGAWLTLRGMQTLPLRMAKHVSNAVFLASRLAEHPAVASVSWPGFDSHPSHLIAKRVLSAYPATFSFDLKGGRDAGRALVTRVGLAKLAPSLGGVETLLLHPASTSHRQLADPELTAAGITSGTIRLSVGIESPDDLWADLSQALSI
ncbi:trans-sulfuration enzyme family protein [Catelliglobosispora koreensis]|uniref:trans-sulfuration enzyme family protein n=1 Tax=Catelliglobosispora koreensis TaxID=129052 RepID=UPI00036FDDA3|nr:aminotransferase class I/II-fold pyridoxal phosphate-dependent enzyme [Catelliglobosispora koreensis]